MPSDSAAFHLRCILALACVSLIAPVSHAQSTAAEIKARLLNKPLYLRGFWSNDNLHFDATGNLTVPSNSVSFTLSGFELESVNLKQNKLILEGRRVGLELANNQQKRVAINVGNPRHPKDEKIAIEVDPGPDGNYAHALDAIFVDNLADIVPTLPLYWTHYAHNNLVPASTTPTPASPAAITTAPNQQPPEAANARPKRVGGSITAPKLLHASEPDFNNFARNLKYSGKVLVNFHIETDGTVSHASIILPLGLGLDERALDAVQHYVFSPAKEAGQPVVVEANVEVNFQIY